MGFNYIVLSIPMGENLVREVPIMYPDFLVHEDVANAIKAVPGMENSTVVSAGSADLGVMSCSGRSTTLNLESRGRDDEVLINSYPYAHGITSR